MGDVNGHWRISESDVHCEQHSDHLSVFHTGSSAMRRAARQRTRTQHSRLDH